MYGSSFWSNKNTVVFVESAKQNMGLKAEAKKKRECLFVCATTNERLQTILMLHTNLFEFIYLCPIFLCLPLPRTLYFELVCVICVLFVAKSFGGPLVYTKPPLKIVHTHSKPHMHNGGRHAQAHMWQCRRDGIPIPMSFVIFTLLKCCTMPLVIFVR